jgi:hypothetical protein
MDSIIFGSALLAAGLRAQGIAPFPIYDPSAFPSLTAATRANTFDEDEAFVRIARGLLNGIYPKKTARENDRIAEEKAGKKT